jgi:CspA family cold shock protein
LFYKTIPFALLLFSADGRSVNSSLTVITMANGTVKFFNASKGFGFIIPSDGGSEVFVHVTGLKDEVRENDEVTYDVEQGKKGLSAVNVKLS